MPEFIRIILATLWFMLPAYLANMAPAIFIRLGLLKFLDKPMDFGRVVGGKRIFGEHKTWRGLVAGVIVAIFTIFLQQVLVKYPFFKEISILDYKNENLWLLGFLFGFGALVGDAVKSYFKRRVGIKPGQPWIPFDQLDFVLGALLAVSVVYVPGWPVIVAAVLITPVLHILTNFISYALRIRETRW